MIDNKDKFDAITGAHELERDISAAVSSLVEEYKTKHNVSISNIYINMISTRPMGQLWEEHVVGKTDVEISVLK